MVAALLVKRRTLSAARVGGLVRRIVEKVPGGLAKRRRMLGADAASARGAVRARSLELVEEDANSACAGRDRDAASGKLRVRARLVPNHGAVSKKSRSRLETLVECYDRLLADAPVHLCS